MYVPPRQRERNACSIGPIDPSLAAWHPAAPLPGLRTGLAPRREGQGQGTRGHRGTFAAVKPSAAKPPNLLAYGDNLTCSATLSTSRPSRST